MRWSASFSLFLLLRAFGAAADIASQSSDLPTVYLYDTQSLKSHADTTQTLVDPNTARLILAQRLGVAAYHEIGDISDSELRHLSQYGVDTKPLTKDGTDYRALVFIDGASNLRCMKP